jgi:tetratricopeptide (TPR) repeat protein
VVSPLGARQLQEDLDALVAADLVHRKRRAKGQSYAFKHALIRDTAYESMLKRARQKVHAEIVAVLRERFSDTPAARPEMLALHLAQAGREAEAVEHVLMAAEASVQRSANAEAIGHAQQAQLWLENMEETRERAVLELRVQSVLITALFALKGPTAPEVEAEIKRAQALIADVGDSPHTIQTLVKLAIYYQMRARFTESISVAEKALGLAERSDDTAAQISALSALVQSFVSIAQFDAARSASLRALSLFDPEEHTSYSIATAGFDLRSVCYGVMSFALWFLGLPDQALTAAQRGRELMERISHPHSIALALLYLAGTHRYRREPGEMGGACGRLHELSQRHGLLLGAYAGVLFGTITGDVEGPQQLLAGLQAHGQVFSMPYWHSTIAETDAAAGRMDAALERIERCISDSERSGEIHYLPELVRLKGTFLLKQGAAGAREAAVDCFRRAIELSRAHKSRLCELRALTAIAPLLDKESGAQEIRGRLLALCNELTEGQDLLDMQEARAALAALSA